jgi:hypothetical protein
MFTSMCLRTDQIFFKRVKMKIVTKAALLSLSAALMLGLTGCGGKEEAAAPEEKVLDDKCRIDGYVTPDWMCGVTNYEGSIVGLGISERLADKSLTMTAAEQDARAKLAMAIETQVKAKVESFARNTGIGDASKLDKVVTAVNKSTAKVTLTGVKTLKSKTMPESGRVYVLLGVSENKVNEAAKNAITAKSSYGDNNALWQQFQSKQALESLEKEFPTD